MIRRVVETMAEGGVLAGRGVDAADGRASKSSFRDDFYDLKPYLLSTHYY